MITVRQIDRLWSAKAYDRLLQQLVSPRPEASGRLLSQLPGTLPAAAMAVIRLDELSQPHAPLYSLLVRTILAAQRPEGGWGDLMVTTLCLRALLCGNGNGEAIECGMAFLGKLQKPEGIWPGMPNRRMPVDAFASAYLLLQLGNSAPFGQAVSLDDARAWFESNDLVLDNPTARLWSYAKRRLPARKTANAGSASANRTTDHQWDLPGRKSTSRQTVDSSTFGLTIPLPAVCG